MRIVFLINKFFIFNNFYNNKNYIYQVALIVNTKIIWIGALSLLETHAASHTIQSRLNNRYVLLVTY